MSHGTMKYSLKAHVYYIVFIAWLLHSLYSLHPYFYTLERDLMGNYFDNGPILKLIVRVRIYHKHLEK